jgi:hypothetical protein
MVGFLLQSSRLGMTSRARVLSGSDGPDTVAAAATNVHVSVVGIHLSADAGASVGMDPEHEARDDNVAFVAAADTPGP